MATGKQTTQPRGDEGAGAGLERLQKVLAASGVASRRAAEELITEGRVSVDGRIVRELGTRVDAAQADIRVDGRKIQRPRLKYLMLNKPRGYLTTASDPEGRRTVYALLSPSDARERVFPIGRLDMDSEGLLLLTNDGEFANRIAHPRHRIDKEYHALVKGHPTGAALAQLRRGGFMLDGGRTSPAQVEVLEQSRETTLLKVIIHEGRRRQVRRIMEEIGHPVERLRRVRLGPLTLAGLPAAGYRPLTAGEVLRMQRLVGLADDSAATPEDETPAQFRRVNEPRALSGRKPLRQGPPGGGDEQRKGRSAGKPASGPATRDERTPPRREQEGSGGTGGARRSDQSGGRRERPTGGGGRPGGGGSGQPRPRRTPAHNRDRRPGGGR